MATDRDLTMLLVGDVYVQRDDPPSIFRHVGELLRGADFTLGNLEGAVADGGTLRQRTSAPHLSFFKADARQIAAIQAAGFDAVGAANNHCLGYGYEGLFESLGHLDRIGVKHAGAGRSKAEAHTPAVVERQSVRVALLAYTSVFAPGWQATDDGPGLAVVRARTAYEPSPRFQEQPGSPPIIRSWAWPEDKAQVAADVAAARQQADLVVCSFHWGVSERYTKLAEYQVEVGRHAIDAGADLVFGHHPHVLQGVEVYRRRAIFYSLGNFAFDMYRPDRFDGETIIVRCRIRDRRIAAVEYLPAYSDASCEPRVLPLAEAGRIIRMVEERSAQFGTRFAPAGEALHLELGPAAA
ncbi:MAG: CapA family protein [Chloroflexi bacterium]|nr:CapA family protein [Chloroflexota bacterium]